MSYSNPYPQPVILPAINAGETDGRFLDCTPDLGAAADTIPSIDVVSLTIARQDGAPISANDLQAAGSAWPNTLDSTGLIPTFGLTAPAAAAGSSYLLTLTVNKTTNGRLFIRNSVIFVASALG